MKAAPQLPSPLAVARMLCEMTADLRSTPDNFERGSLRVAADLLASTPPAVDAAISELGDAVGHAYRGHFVESRPEAALAVAALLILKTACAAAPDSEREGAQ